MNLYPIITIIFLLLAYQAKSVTTLEHVSFIYNNIKIDRYFSKNQLSNLQPNYKFSLDRIGNPYQPYSLIKHEMLADGQREFIVNYDIGEFGLRKISNEHLPRYSKIHIITAGDSNTFGEGINEEYLLSVLISKKIPSSRPYNMGIAGAGPNSTLALMEFFPWEKLIKEENGCFIFNYYDFLIERVIGYKNVIEWSNGNHPYYKFNNRNRVEYSGSFNDRFLTKIFKYIISVPWLNKLLPALPRPSQNHIKIIAQIFVQMKEEYLKKFPKGHFIVSISRFYGVLNADRLNKVEIELKKNNIDLITVSAQEFNPKFLFKDDHLNPSGHIREADLMLKALTCPFSKI